MPELLIELASEEIPARMQARAALDLERLVNQQLIDAGFLTESVKAFATPRRLTLVVAGLPAQQPDRKEEKKGPRVGAPEKALEGFLKSAGLASVDACEIREDKKGAYYVAQTETKGRATADIVAAFMPELIGSFPWPKSMRWGDGELRWVRPLTSILTVFNDEVVPFSVDGIESADVFYGHRAMATGPMRARNFESYVAALTGAKVMLDAASRADLIENEARTLCQAQGLDLIEDKALLDEVAGLAEWPVVMIGGFDEKFLTVPDEALIASMRGHQKYFSVRDPGTGTLANKFVYVANIEAADGGAAMREGYERVLTARLSDAWFLYRQDLETPLRKRVGDLDRVTFFEGLGTVGDKARRIAALAGKLAPATGADPATAEEAAILAKADLTTGMVYEFPELQGLMGRYYALEEGAPAEIADAIRDHYKPLGADDSAATAPVSAAVALADKIDTLAAFWAIGKKPTGSKDPFALRRAALGVIETILAENIRIPLSTIFDTAIDAQAAQAPDGAANDLLGFIHDRLKVYFRDKGGRHDQIGAVLAKPNGGLEDDIYLTARKLDALSAFLATEDGANLAAGYKRAVNILRAEQKKGAAFDGVDESAITEGEEKSLYAALTDAEEQAQAAMTDERFEEAMASLASLRAPIDAFFEAVTVNADDEKLRANRLALLERFRKATAQVADLSALEG